MILVESTNPTMNEFVGQSMFQKEKDEAGKTGFFSFSTGRGFKTLIIRTWKDGGLYVVKTTNSLYVFLKEEGEK